MVPSSIISRRERDKFRKKNSRINQHRAIVVCKCAITSIFRCDPFFFFFFLSFRHSRLSLLQRILSSVSLATNTTNFVNDSSIESYTLQGWINHCGQIVFNRTTSDTLSHCFLLRKFESSRMQESLFSTEEISGADSLKGERGILGKNARHVWLGNLREVKRSVTSVTAGKDGIPAG